VGEGRDLRADRFHELGHGVADCRHRDARSQVEDAIAVGVHEDGALGAFDVDGEARRETGAHRRLATFVKGARVGPWQFGDHLAFCTDLGLD